MNLIKKNYDRMGDWDMYAANLDSEKQQCIDEGLDIEEILPLFEEAQAMGNCPEKTEIASRIFSYVCNAKIREDYKYNEPDSLEEIKALRGSFSFSAKALDEKELFEKLYGAWMGRAVGCLLGKPVEGVRADSLVPFLEITGNYPMHRYIFSEDADKAACEKHENFNNFKGRCYADTVDGMPVDDDTNYVVLGQYIIDSFGKEFQSSDVIKSWVAKQSINSYFTAERVAFVNYINGFEPPCSAKYKNPFREWIGAQIRGDYYGYICPGNPERAAELAFKDAAISHVKNGIYGEMFISAMLSVAAVNDDIISIIEGGLSQIPKTSRLYEAVKRVMKKYISGVSSEECFEAIHKEYDEHTGYGWCHTIPNAMIVTAALLYGENDFGKSICLAVQTGFDTDCNGATVGSVMGMKNGVGSISEEWRKPLNDKINTSISGFEAVSIKECAEKTMKHTEGL